ncbi:prolipoprotein diacylglyceryl transferase family protein [Undibacterium sp. Xuan67W]|uniref:prolipoprotein diacylglyceryl transferase family protein n=1 Tax=Undibacterium sp. Xuan67W TaxID=3413057 RepID=UPI003BF0D964
MTFIPLSVSNAHLVHLFFEWAAIATGMQLYRQQRQQYGLGSMLQTGSYAVMIGCIAGAAMGNKLVFWLEFPHLWSQYSIDMTAWMSGQSIVGGLLGGLIGIELTKKMYGLTQSTGDQFVLPLVAGTIVGRIGCFFAGLHDGTYGNPTGLPWGIDFGDGISRHPTQLYDMLFAALFGGALLMSRKRWVGKPGLLFKFYLSGYLAWRFAIDAIKPVPYDYGFGLSGIQCICLLALLIYLPLVIKQSQALEHHAIPQT